MKNKNEVFIEKARNIHGNKYDYSKVEYVKSNEKVCIICHEHGEFWQRPNDHLNGQGCKLCGIQRNSNRCKMTKEEFIRRSSEIHNGKYDYSKVEYVNNHTKVCIICPEHGEFWQKPVYHLNSKCECPQCALEKKHNNQRLGLENFIINSNLIHNNAYVYSEVNYTNNKNKVKIICPIHGEFFQRPNDHVSNRQGCPKCGMQTSNSEDEIINLLKKVNPQQRNKNILNGKEIDIYIPSLGLGIEYNGLRWHSEEFGKDKNYHINKLLECNKNNIKLIQIFEDEWINHREICESKLKQICGLTISPKIYGRKCEIRQINDKNEVYSFLDKNHIQGRTGFTVALGCYFNDELIGAMTFKREKDGYWDLNRFATDIHYQCIGIGGKLFKYFTRHFDFIEVKSFADRRWTINPSDNLYTKLGFEFDSFVKPSYTYYNIKTSRNERYHKFGFRKKFLSEKYGLPITMTELEMTKELGYTRIWDCGLIKYIYKK